MNAVAEAAPASNAYDPVLRWLIFTGLSLFAAVLLWSYGLIRLMVVADPTSISTAIAALYVAASLHALWRAIVLSRERAALESLRDAWARMAPDRDRPSGRLAGRGCVLNHIGDLAAKARAQGRGPMDQTLLLRALAQKLYDANALGALAGDTLLKFGLLGTIIGFILMLGPVSALGGEDETAVRASMAVMSEGMSVAMYTTLAGLVGSLLLRAQYFLLDATTARLLSDVVRLTEIRLIPVLERRDV